MSFLKIAILFGLLPAAALVPQQPTSTALPETTTSAKPDPAQPPPSAEPIEMENWINGTGDQAGLSRRLIVLGVDKRTAEQFSGSDNNTGVVLRHWQYVRAENAGSFALLFLPCDWTDLAHLYVMKWSAWAWHATDSNEFDCHYDASVSLEVGPIRSLKWDAIRVHHACVGHGSGFLEQSFSVFEISAGKLRSQLETDEVFHASPTANPPQDVDRSSTFTVIPISGTHERAIEETRSVAYNDHLVRVERRVFRWVASKSRYVPSAFTNVEATVR